MIRTVARALRATLVLAVLTGVAYPLVITAMAQVAVPRQSDGSLVREDGRVVGSSMIGQSWDGTQWFHGRPSAVAYDASTSAGSNLGPSSRELADVVSARVQAILSLEGPYVPDLTVRDIPVDLLTASASGLDPHISIAAAELQAPRIAAVRGVPLERVQDLIREHTDDRVLGILGRPRVNVLELNLALGRLGR